MTWYYYLNYRIYNFYSKKRESIPQIYSFMGSTLLMHFNIFSIVYVIEIILDISIISTLNSLLLGLFLGLFNYIILYRSGYYKEVFLDFDKSRGKYDHWKNTVPIYIITSIAILLIVLALADYRFDGKF